MHWTDLITKFFDESFASRWSGACSGWSKELVIFHVIADFLIWSAYMMIPVLLVLIVRKRKDLPFDIFFWLFALFIVGCGFTHFMNIVTAFYPFYYMDFWFKAITAAASVGTAWVLYKAFPAIVSFPNPFKTLELLETSNKELLKKDASLTKANIELERFAYIASHDLKAPLRAITNLAGWINDEAKHTLPENCKKYLDLMNSRVTRMNKLIDGILEYSRAGRVHVAVSNVNLNFVINSIAEALGNSIIVPDALPVIRGNAVAIEQVFQNLINNGFKHNDKENAEVTVTFRDIGDFWEFTIADNGPGIPKDLQYKLFVIFQTLKPVDAESTGIGLALCKKIVEQEGGKIWIDSDEGLGAKFIFTWLK